MLGGHRRPYSNQHQSVKGTEFHTNYTFKLQQTITNTLIYKSDPSGNAVNLSKHSLSFDTYKLLDKNLNFIPTSKRYNKNQLSSDSQNFFQLIKLRAHFKDETCITIVNQPNEHVPFKIKNKEKWNPKETHHTVSTYIDLVENDINAPYNKDLIITNADKGGALIIMNTDSYIKEDNQQLSHKASYKQLTQDPTLQHNRMVNQTIERFKNQKLLPKKIADGLKVINPKIPKFYMSRKIHKPNNPGKPVIDLIECHTSEISRFVHYHLQPVVKQIPSYIKDTNHFINKVNNFSVPVNSILVTMNIRSLYMSIPHNEGITATNYTH